MRLAQGSISFAHSPQSGTAGQNCHFLDEPRFETVNLIFSNGVRAILSPNKSESGQVRVLVRFGRGFQAVSPDKGRPLSGPMVLGENGIGKFDRNAIDKLTNGRRSGAQLFGG